MAKITYKSEEQKSAEASVGGVKDDLSPCAVASIRGTGGHAERFLIADSNPIGIIAKAIESGLPHEISGGTHIDCCADGVICVITVPAPLEVLDE